jgi:hypothetical protein
MQLTDSEQNNLLEGLSTVTRQKFKAMCRKVDQIIEISTKDFAEIQALRAENKTRNKIDGWRFLQSIAVDVAKKIEKFNGS